MVVDFEFSGDVCILRMHGRFATGQDSAYLRSKTDEIKKSDCLKVLADFSEVSYVDSTGIGFVIGIYTSVTKNPDGMFVLANPNERVLEVLELCKLNTVIPIFPDLASAMQALQQGRQVSASR